MVFRDRRHILPQVLDQVAAPLLSRGPKGPDLRGELPTLFRP